MDDKIIEPNNENAFCFEKPLSNILSFTKRINFLVVNREEEFAPIIYEKGTNSCFDAKIILSNLHKKWIQDKSKFL